MNQRPLFFGAAFYISGILASELAEPPILLCFLIAVASVLFALGFLRKPTLRTVFVCCAILACGALRLQMQKHAATDPTLAAIPTYAKIAVLGHVVAEPVLQDQRVRFDLTLFAFRRDTTWQPVSGRLRVTAPNPEKPIRAQEEVLVIGNLAWPLGSRNPGEFDYRRYLHGNGIQATLLVRSDGGIFRSEIVQASSLPLSQWVAAARQGIRQSIYRIAEPQTATVLTGLLLGDRSEIDPAIQDDFARSGIIHVLAVSGLHVGFVLLICVTMAGFLRITGRGALLFTGVAIWFYAALTGLNPPVVRASLMATLFLLARFRDRPTDAANLLAAAALIILFIQPLALFQVGFQLSFAAVTAILFLHSRCESAVKTTRVGQIIYRYRFSRWAMGLIIVSFVAQLGTLPFSAHHFGRVSLVGVLANLPTIPLVFLAVATSFLGLAFLPLSASVGKIYGAVASFAMQIIFWFSDKLSAMPWASLDNWYPPVWVLIVYVLLVIALFFWRHRRVRAFSVIAILLVANAHVWSEVVRDQQQLVVTMLDVGQGDASFVHFPNGKNLLVDAGPSFSRQDAGERHLVPFLRRQGVEKLDMVIVSHPHADHIGGLPTVLRSMPVEKIVFADTAYTDRLFRKLLRLVDSLEVSITVVKRGDVLADFTPAKIWVLGPTPRNARLQSHLNDASLLLQLRFGGIAVLLTGDTERAGELSALPFGYLLHSEVLKVGHHGSTTSSSPAFIETVAPRWATVSVGAFNKFGHPNLEVMQRIANKGGDTLRTDLLGAVAFASDGVTIWRLR